MDEQEPEQPQIPEAEDIRTSADVLDAREVVLGRLKRGDNAGAIAVALFWIGEELGTIRNVLISIDESMPAD